jgi:paraquat-inducible protein B
MAKRVSSAAIGVFVVGSLALVILVAAVLGSGQLFRRPHLFVCFFSGSLNGLKLGAPVKVRGVEIGAVTRISLGLSPSEGQMRSQELLTRLPVVFEVDETQLRHLGGTGQAFRPGELQRLINGGLRAQLNVESMLTGLLYIDLDRHPDTPIDLALVPGTSRYPEIPTVPTSIEQLQEGAMRAIAKLDKIDFPGLVNSMNAATVAIKDLVGDPALKESIVALKQTANSATATFDNLNAKVDPLVAGLQKTSTAAELTLNQATATLGEVRTAIAPGSPLGYQLTTTLEDLSEASRSINDLADYLSRNPGSLVRGKYVSDSGK